MEKQIFGKIMQGVGGLYTVRILSAPDDCPIYATQQISCHARGSFRHNHITPLPGDNVLLSLTNTNSKDKSTSEEAVIEEICERKNSLIRPPLANLDYLFITMAVSSPTPILSTVDKLISIAEFNNIEPIIVITKCELHREFAKELEEIYQKSGFTVFCLSSYENIGIENIKKFIFENMTGKISAFAGASGIGKSTLLNSLFPNLCLTTSEISRKIERGKHTTRKAELFALSDSSETSYIADTPGFSMLDFERFDFFELEDLPLTMRDFIPYIGKCRYKKCSHTKEEGCAIINAVKSGDIPPSRHESFCELYTSLKNKKKW